MRTRSSRRGLTLIEVLIASTIIAIAFLGFFSMQAQIIRSSDDARRMTECEALAESKMDQLRSIRWCETSGEAMPAELGLAGTGSDPAESGGSVWGPLAASPGGLVNQAWDLSGTATEGRGDPMYDVSWQTEPSNETTQVFKLKVKCSYTIKGLGGSSGVRGLQLVSYYMGNDC